MNIKLVNRK